jgi:hypothetical protein
MKSKSVIALFILNLANIDQTNAVPLAAGKKMDGFAKSYVQLESELEVEQESEEGAADFAQVPSEKSDLDDEPALAQADAAVASEVAP